MDKEEQDIYKSLWAELKSKTNEFTVDKGEVLATPDTSGRVGDLLNRYYNKVIKNQDGEYTKFEFEGSKKLQNSFDESWVEDTFNNLMHLTEDWDDASFYDSVSFGKISHGAWKNFVIREAKKRWDKIIERGMDKQGWTPEDALLYGLERIEDVDYTADFDYTEDEYQELLDDITFYAKYKKPENYDWADDNF